MVFAATTGAALYPCVVQSGSKYLFFRPRSACGEEVEKPGLERLLQISLRQISVAKIRFPQQRFCFPYFFNPWSLISQNGHTNVTAKCTRTKSTANSWDSGHNIAMATSTNTHVTNLSLEGRCIYGKKCFISNNSYQKKSYTTACRLFQLRGWTKWKTFALFVDCKMRHGPHKW